MKREISRDFVIAATIYHKCLLNECTSEACIYEHFAGTYSKKEVSHTLDKLYDYAILSGRYVERECVRREYYICDDSIPMIEQYYLMLYERNEDEG